MGSLDWILAKLNELYIAKHVTGPHDEARASFAVGRNTVDSMNEFTDIIRRYYEYHFSKCISFGGQLSAAEAEGAAKQILETKYGKGREGLVAAYNDARYGTNGGLRVIIDTICDHIKAQSMERHIRKVFDDEISLNSWEDRVEIIRQLFSHLPREVTRHLNTNNPVQYADHYEELIRAHMRLLQQSSAIFRRL